MRFITEFELVLPAIEQRVDAYKSRGNLDLGCGVAESFGWFATPILSMMGPHTTKYTLEIEAFPMDKWVEFKQKLFEYIQNADTMVSLIPIVEMIKELESLGKPAGEAKELNPNNNI